MNPRKFYSLFLAGLCFLGTALPVFGASFPAALMDRPVTVSGNGKSHTIAVLGKDGNIWTEKWSGSSELGGPVSGWSCWTRQADLVLGDGKVASSPWLQAPNGAGTINLFALGQGDSTRRICQWTMFTQAFQGTNGIAGADSVVTSLASAQTNSGWQTLFAIFADSSLRYRQWDSVNWVWSGWKVLGSGFALLPPFATQVTATDVNVYATRPDGIVIQNWWNGTTWSGWVTPPWQKVASSPASVNLDWTTHFLFARDSGGNAVGAIWNGSNWTALPPSEIPVLSGVSAVVADTDSVLIYAKAPDSSLIRFPWSRKHSWGAVEHLDGPGSCGTTSVKHFATGPLREIRWESGSLRLSQDLAEMGGTLGVFALDGRHEANLAWSPGQTSLRASLHSGLHQVRMESGSAALFVP